MSPKRFLLSARITSNNPSVIKATIKGFIGPHGTIMPTDGGFEIKTILSGGSAKELNRSFLSEMRRIEKRTRLSTLLICGKIFIVLKPRQYVS